MKERPILFSGPMVRAILEGRKRRRKLYAPRGTDLAAPELLARRLANGLDAAPNDACWEWKRTTNGQGYGTLRVSGRLVYAHRLAYELGVGPVPKGLHVLHSCDNPRCINPSHLSPGTRSQNMKECSQRGRARIPKPIKRGESNGAAVLNDATVRSIRRLLADGWLQREIAERHGVSQSIISRINLGKAWTHLQ